MAFGAFVIKEELQLSDRETVEQIQENPYLQYFFGLEDFILLNWVASAVLNEAESAEIKGR